MLEADADWLAISIAGSKRVRWDIDRDVVRARRHEPLDKCLPDAMTGAGQLGFLSEHEQLLLARVQARTYAQVAAAADRLMALYAWRAPQATREPAIEALVRMVDEKLKHRDLFRQLARELGDSLPTGPAFAHDSAATEAVLGLPRWALLGLALHTQLSAQAHYRCALAARERLCPLWADVFLFHWKEEAQHAMLVESAWRTEDRLLGDEARERAAGQLLRSLEHFATRLDAHAAADADGFLAVARRFFTSVERAALRDGVREAYRRQHVVQGLEEPRFAATLASLLAPSQLHRWNARATPSSPTSPTPPIPTEETAMKHAILATFAVACLIAAAFAGAPPAEPIQPIPQAPTADAAKAELGKVLFFDKRLSKGDSISCASCHAFDKGGAWPALRPMGAGGKEHPFNSPSVFNTAFNFRQLWGGGQESVDGVVEAVVKSPFVFASSWPEVMGKLSADAALQERFRKSYPAGLTQENVVQAIAEYTRSLTTPNARFDQYLRGKADAITKEERAGYELFKKNGCVACHNGVNVGGNAFRKFGLAADYFAGRGELKPADQGRFNVTKREEDRHVFKVPSLRNVALTAPYFHDGSAATLPEAVQAMFVYQLGRPAPAQDVELIVKFLGTLTGEAPKGD